MSPGCIYKCSGKRFFPTILEYPSLTSPRHKKRVSMPLLCVRREFSSVELKGALWRRRLFSNAMAVAKWKEAGLCSTSSGRHLGSKKGWWGGGCWCSCWILLALPKLIKKRRGEEGVGDLEQAASRSGNWHHVFCMFIYFFLFYL